MRERDWKRFSFSFSQRIRKQHLNDIEMCVRMALNRLYHAQMILHFIFGIPTNQNLSIE